MDHRGNRGLTWSPAETPFRPAEHFTADKVADDHACKFGAGCGETPCHWAAGTPICREVRRTCQVPLRSGLGAQAGADREEGRRGDGDGAEQELPLSSELITLMTSGRQRCLDLAAGARAASSNRLPNEVTAVSQVSRRSFGGARAGSGGGTGPGRRSCVPTPLSGRRRVLGRPALPCLADRTA